MEVELVGTGWRQLLDELSDELHSLDPSAVLVQPVINSDGLLRLRARFSPAARREGGLLLRKYEERAIITCELCGGGGRVYAGPVLTVRCESCFGPHGAERT
jgi:hypothetical protein